MSNLAKVVQQLRQERNQAQKRMLGQHRREHTSKNAAKSPAHNSELSRR